MVQGMGMVLETLRQPVINGYLIAGSIVGPGGLQMIKVSARGQHDAHRALMVADALGTEEAGGAHQHWAHSGYPNQNTKAYNV